MSTVSVEVVFADEHDQYTLPLTLPSGASVADALGHARADLQFAAFVESAVAFGVWGEVVDGNRLLQDGDRVELYRPLVADPKEARRQRAQQD